MADCPTKRLLRAGTLALFSAALLSPAATVGMARAAAAEDGGEGGEGGGESGSAPLSYALNSKDPNQWSYDAAPAIETYGANAFANYSLAEAGAASLANRILELLDAPSEESLAAARDAWRAARPLYLLTEAYRFTDTPIEAVEADINAWPLNEAYLDYVQGAPQAGLINDPNFKSSDAEAIASLNQKQDEADVTTGWHAIEFLLWGQDLSADGPGARPHTDYIAGTPANDKRRAFLKAIADKLVEDLGRVVAQWDPSNPAGYAAALRAMKPREAVGRMLNGLAVLAGHEMRDERLAVALDSGDQEDEQSCFSDTTKQDFVVNLTGIADIYLGRGQDGRTGPSLAALVRTLDPALAGRIDTALANAAAAVADLGDPWDQTLASPPGSPEREKGEAAVEALGALAKALKEAGPVLGVLVQVPGL
jgi:putative iron-regulated protein